MIQKRSENFFVSFLLGALRFTALACLVVVFSCAGFDDAHAAKKKKTKSANATENKRYAAIVADAQTGEVLMARSADSIRHPASLTKMMTLYMVFEAVDRGSLKMSDRMAISKHAAGMSPSKLGLPAGSKIRVEDGVKALVTKSANDIAAAFGEKLAGSERNFASRMTRRAKELGMTRTVFRNASGLPDRQQVTTARDMAKLAMALLRDFPHYYHYFGITNFSYNGKNHHNHNRLLGEYRGLDGIKTGYINDSGFNLVASAKQNGRRLVGVVFGGQTWRSRNDHMVKLLDEGFATLATRGPQIQEASLKNGSVPIPPPPPMFEDARGAAPVVTQYAYSTDGAEEDGAYSEQGSQKLAGIIDQVEAQGYERTEQNSVPPIPAPRPYYGQDDAGQKSYANENAATTPTGAARTVMQLRMPRDQLPKGIPQSQIVASAESGGWSVQVGAFQSRAMTDKALRTAQARLPAELQDAQAVIVPQSTGNGIVFRARLQGYTEIEANSACAHLGSCLVVSPGS